MPVAAVRSVLALVAVAAVSLLSACVPVFACPAIGYMSTLHVTIESGASAVTRVEVCDETGCGPTLDTASSWSLVTATGEGPDWVFTGSFPEQFTVRVHGSDGSVLADDAVDPDWVRTGGSAACGGPAEASVTISL